MQAAVRVDASRDIGYGHVMRCLALTDALRGRGLICTFICRDLPGHLGALIQRRDYEVVLLDALPYQPPTQPDDYAAWLQTTVAADAEDTLKALPADCELVIVDHYALGIEWERCIGQTGRRIVAIDDLCREHHADILVDQTLGRQADEYAASAVTEVLTGSHYALLRSEFYRYREQRASQSGTAAAEQPQRVLLTMGGVDQPNATLAILDTLLADLPAWVGHIDVVLPATAPHFKAVAKRVKEFQVKQSQLVLHEFVDNIAELMLHADLAVGAPGISTWERATLGIPSILVPLASNQREIAAALERNGAALTVELAELRTGLMPALQKLQAGQLQFSQTAAQICDGLGARRVAQRILPAVASTGGQVHLRRLAAATATSTLTRTAERWQHWSDSTRFGQWLAGFVSQPQHYCYAVCHAGNEVGVIALRRTAHMEYELGLYIDPAFASSGVGLPALELVAELHQEIGLRIVLDESLASRMPATVLERRGFRKTAATAFHLPPRQP